MKIRDIIHENRVRIALQSELVKNGDHLDGDYINQINCILSDKSARVED